MNDKNNKNNKNDKNSNILMGNNLGINIDIHNNIDNLEINNIKFKKICFIYNAIEDGWNVKKKENTYIFSKKHEGKKEVYLDSYLQTFIEKNMN
jgi:hypothetical protein